MSLDVYVNGQFLPKERATVSVFDHGLLYGDGIFEGIRAYNRKVFRLHEHIGRLYESARVIKLNVPMMPDDMTEAVVESCQRADIDDAYIRLIVTRGVGSLGLSPSECKDPQVIIIVDRIALYPESVYEQGMKVITVPTRRTSDDALSPRVKSLNYLNNIMAKMEADHLGYPEALMQNQQGFVVEGTADNLFCIRRGSVITPPENAGILPGITRATVMDIARDCGYEVYEQNITRGEIFQADEVFLTGTAAEVVPVVEVDGRQIGTGNPGHITTRFMELYRELTRNQGEPY